MFTELSQNVRLGPNYRNTRYSRKSLQKCMILQDLLMADCQNPATIPKDRAALVRSWCFLEERKRILLGIPLPGQLRPDLDPVQLSRALHRQKQRLITDVGSETFSGPREAEPEIKATKTAKAKTQPQASACPETGQAPKDDMPTTNHTTNDCHKESLYGMDPSPRGAPE